MSRHRALTLNDDEIVALDGRCRPETQKHVDRAKQRVAAAARLTHLDPAHAGLIADALSEALATGRLDYRGTNIQVCPLCQADAGYHVYKRDSRYHAKGEVRYDKPKSMRAIDLKHSFIIIRGHVSIGCCVTCFGFLRADLVAALEDIPAHIPTALTGVEPKFTRHNRVECSQCGWEGHEGQMGRRPTLMLNGTYPALCPSCGAENKHSGPYVVKTIAGFVVTDADGHEVNRG